MQFKPDTAKSDLHCVAFGARSQTRFFDLALARQLKERFGTTIHLYCSGPQEVDFYSKHNVDGLFETVTDASVIEMHAFDSDLDDAQVFERARGFEERIGLTINRMIVPDRHFGRGYCLGGYYHPRSRRSENTSYTQAVHAYCEALAFWETEFRGKGVTACLNAPREAANMASEAGIPYRTLIASRFRNYHCWAVNPLYENPEFERRWNEIAEVGDLAIDQPYHAHLASRRNYLKHFSLRSMLRHLVITTMTYAYWNLRGYKKAKGYYYLSTMNYHLRTWLEYRRLRRLSKTKLDDMKGIRFVYYPLHMEPEAALHGISPEYFYQHALIAAVSRDLPAGVRLVVKEAFGNIGRRPANFYRQIADLKNVVWLDCWEMGLDCAKQADAVVTICGTVGLEAAVSGTPVIAFGQHNLYNFLPSVMVVNDERKLKSYLQKALFDADLKARTQEDGGRLLQAIVDSSFDMGGYDYIRLQDFEQTAVQAASAALEHSLGAVTPHEKTAD